jgi:2-amino-4-hydroxy-6-hydroxymethyldihydropteridine diphosphokinase
MASKTTILIAMGSNTTGHWGSPSACLARAHAELNFAFNGMTKVSAYFKTNPVGFVRQPKYLNAVIRVQANITPLALMRFLKDLERRAGRKTGIGTRWGPRPLDLDIVDHGRKVNGWHAKYRQLVSARRPDFLILPHPRAHLRAFVLQPLLQVEPNWWHPVLRVPGRQLLQRLSTSRPCPTNKLESTRRATRWG